MLYLNYIMFKEDLIQKIINHQIYFQGDGYYAAVMYKGEAVIMTNATEDYPYGCIVLDELSFEELEYIAKWHCWFMEEPTIYA